MTHPTHISDLGHATADDPSGLPFRSLLETLPAGAYTCDRDGLITYFNRAAAQLWGRAPTLNDAVDRFCGSFKLLAADGSPIDHRQCWMAQALRNEREYNGEEIVIERPDGSRVTVLAHTNPVRDKLGQIVGAVNMLVDISDRKRAEEAQATLAAIVESSDDAIVSKTFDGVIRSWNAAAERLFGYTADEAIGSPITLIIPPELHDEESGILARLHRGERIEHFETVRMAKDGRRIDISLTISPLRDAAGRLSGASKVARDITARKRADEALSAANDELTALYDQLRAIDQRKDEFLAVLAHELRNPLAPISNALQLLRIAGDLSPGAERLREIMERQASQMIRLLDDLLDVSRFTRGRIDLRKETVELSAVVANALETSRPLIEAFGHQVAISLPHEPVVLEADAVRLSQVVSNLLNNAAKYTDNGGQIWLAARREQNEAVISVRDNGMGIPSDMLPRVFEMFAQVDGSPRRAHGGLGIGLTLAKNLVEMHGGRIEARSEGLGQGSEFIVRLPIVPHAPPLREAKKPRPLSAAPLPARSILVVDDTRSAAYVLGKLLESIGQNVRIVGDAASALESARAERPDVVFSDIGMPKMDGYELARRLRREAGLDGVVLVALTGYGQDSDRQRAKDAGFDHHLVKPVSLEALQNLLSTLDAPLETLRRQPSR